MIKRVIGNLFAVVVVVVIVFTALGAGSYRSMLSEDLFSPTVTQEQPAAPNAVADAAVAEESAEEPQAIESEVTEAETEDVAAEAESEEGQK